MAIAMGMISSAYYSSESGSYTPERDGHNWKLDSIFEVFFGSMPSK